MALVLSGCNAMPGDDADGETGSDVNNAAVIGTPLFAFGPPGWIAGTAVIVVGTLATGVAIYQINKSVRLPRNISGTFSTKAEAENGWQAAEKAKLSEKQALVQAILATGDEIQKEQLDKLGKNGGYTRGCVKATVNKGAQTLPIIGNAEFNAPVEVINAGLEALSEAYLKCGAGQTIPPAQLVGKPNFCHLVGISVSLRCR